MRPSIFAGDLVTHVFLKTRVCLVISPVPASNDAYSYDVPFMRIMYAAENGRIHVYEAKARLLTKA